MIGFYILEILDEHSSKERKLMQSDILAYLKKDYNIMVTRNTLSKYLKELREKGRVTGARGVYSVREFSNNEIAIMLNSVTAVKAVPNAEIQNIVKKLRSMAEPEERGKFCHSYYLSDLNHTDNGNVGTIINTIQRAIEDRKKLEITACGYNVDGELQQGKTYIVDPYYIVMEKSRAYLLCYSGREDVEPRRIDRMENVKIMKEKRMEICQIDRYKNRTFQIEEYMKEHIYMYSGESARITLKIRKSKIGDFIDWFGKEYRKIQEQEEYIIIQVKANVEAVYFWSLQYSRIAEVIAPEKLRKKIKEGAEEIVKMYE